MLNKDPSTRVAGYIESKKASRAVGRNGEPFGGGESSFMSALEGVGVPFDAGEIGTSTLVVRLVAMSSRFGEVSLRGIGS